MSKIIQCEVCRVKDPDQVFLWSVQTVSERGTICEVLNTKSHIDALNLRCKIRKEIEQGLI
jgi:hypothetical protein